jgi:hypothetical protein
VPALDLVVGVGQRPADLLGEPPRHRHRHHAARLQDAAQLSHRVGVGGQVLEHLGRDDLVERRVRERQAVRRPPDRVGLRALGRLALDGDRGEHLAHLDQLRVAVVEGDDPGAALEEREGVTAAAAAHVEDPVAGADGEPLEVDREH